MGIVRRILPLFAALALASGQERVVESVVPALAYGPRCSSTVTLHNLSDRPVVVDVEAHRTSGALVAIVGHPEITVRLSPRERSSYKLAIEEETESAWVKVRERVPSPRLSPVVAITGATECVIGDQLRSAGRWVVYPTLSPWFSGDVTDLHGGLLSLINTSEHAAKASACYSSRGLYSTPGGTRTGAELMPICNTSFEVQIPPFGAREFPVAWGGSSHFSLKTQGAAIVLEMLRPLEANVKMYKVDSNIQFASEVPAGPGKR
jgi:hypothetical protein